ncbi:blast:E3 ubiquitin-protein ligase RBBP6 [Drosophila guanche]|uniref:Blast:E3 ubiquitin-protein ligase RBBP6 n=1 Tax=Drosophila guanche TaxID=7266 RepID=A0A3B0IZ58_DROGU|nr:blast:E3 ubiquitin-protein ligase RBBP6 [Drosophila guanche]
MSVHYKFKSTLNFDTITFDGLHISVGDLKREIVQQKRLGKIIDFDLQITNAQTKEEYKDDGVLIPKNTTLIISRIPLAHPTKKGWEPPAENAAPAASSNKQENFNMDLSKMQGTEEDKIHAMMMQSTVDYDPKTYQRIKGQSQVGEVPASYRCNKCKKTGHWIKNCPNTGGKDQFEVKRTTGIPRSFRDKTETATEEEAAMFVIPAEQSQEIPEDLICGICRDIFVDAVMIPCCGSSFCDDCVRNSLLESEESECPDCKEKNCSPGSLIPNRFLRNSVNAFKNETGYTMRAAKSVAVKKVEKPIDEKPPGSEDKPIEEKPNIEEKPIVEKVEKEPAAVEVASKEKSLKQEEQPETNGNKHTHPPKVTSLEPAEAKPTAITTTDGNAHHSQKEKEKEKEKEKDKYDSDYEDNITITMPQTLADSASIVSSKMSPTYPRKPPAHHVSHRREHKMDYMSESDMKRRPTTQSQSQSDSGKPHNERGERGERSLLPTPISTHQSYQGHHVVNEPDEVHRGNVYKPPYMQMPRGPPPLHMMGHHIPPQYSNGYNNMGQRPPLSFVPYQNQPVHPIRAQYGPSGGNMNMNMSQQFQSPNLASIYQGVAAKVGSGLIDDPLEAFNRIMKEKERQKSERFRSVDHHRSRSPDRQRSHRFKSPVYEKESLRDLNLKDKRPRSRERKREYSYERHTRHNRPSRLDGSKSPINKMKRSAPRRSISPKGSYKSDFRDKSYSKPSAPRLDPIEPPPPGFEGMQLFDEAAAYKPKHHLGSSGGHAKRGAVADDDMPRKRQRSRSRSKETHQKLIDTSFRSLTPPPAKIAITGARQPTVGSSHDHRERTPKTPERGREEYCVQPIPRAVRSPNAVPEATPVNFLDGIENAGKENKSKSPLTLKERKKKKKDKTERKKNKKDKKVKKEKEKHERAKKSSSMNRSDSELNSMQQIEQTCKITPPLRAMAESFDKYESASNSPAQGSRSHEVVKPIKALFAVEAPHKHHFGEENVSASSRGGKRSDAASANAMNLSKWELEENSLSCNFDDSFKRSGSVNSTGEHNEITSDVIRKAENAIFAKAINAIRPVEFQVVINSKGNSKDRSVSIRNDNKDRSLSPKQRPSSKSVKERLGNKVVRERSRSEDKSRGGKRREIVAKVAGDDDGGYRGRADRAHSGSRRRDKQSRDRDRDRALSTEKRHSQQARGGRTLPESDRQRRPYKDAKHHDKFDQINIHDSDRRGVRSVKSGEGRIVSSVSVAAAPPKPCRPDNPFRRAGDSSSSSNLVLKYDNTIQNDGSSHPASGRSAPEKQKEKDKKLKKHAKYSSTDSLKSEKRKELKSKRKSKIMKKKKKSKK